MPLCRALLSVQPAVGVRSGPLHPPSRRRNRCRRPDSTRLPQHPFTMGYGQIVAAGYRSPARKIWPTASVSCNAKKVAKIA
jgi:hypothetical protein